MLSQVKLAPVLATALFMSACGGDDDDGPATCAELAVIVGACGGDTTEAEFVSGVCDLLVLEGDCLSAAADAECAEHDEEDPAYSDVCFPACDAGTPSECLDGDTIFICGDGQEYVFYCDAVCEQNAATYTGTCANEYEGMPSQNGMDVCWCM
jgi:hypothetical protein